MNSDNQPVLDDVMPTMPPFPLPERAARRPVSVEVDTELYAATRRELAKHKVTFRKVVEWALRSYLAAHNPAEAERLGIKAAC